MAREGPETRLVRQMRDAGKSKYGSKLVVLKYHGNQFGEAGVSDLLCCFYGVFVAVEVKHLDTKHGKAGPTLKQKAFGIRVTNAGGVFVVCYSVESFLETLDKIEREHNEQQRHSDSSEG